MSSRGKGGVERACLRVLLSILQGVRDGHLVRVFKLGAGGEAAAEARDAKGRVLAPKRRENTLEVKRGRVALGRGVCAEDEFQAPRLLRHLFHPRKKLFQMQARRS